MNLEVIKSELEYQQVLKRLDNIFHAKEGTKEQEELEILVKLIERYETQTIGKFSC